VLEIEFRVTAPFAHSEIPLPPPSRVIRYFNVPRYVFTKRQTNRHAIWIEIENGCLDFTAALRDPGMPLRSFHFAHEPHDYDFFRAIIVTFA